jgi:hypothetical protein
MYANEFSPNRATRTETFDETELREMEERTRQKDSYLQEKASRGFDLLMGRVALDQKQLVKQLDQLSFLFWRGSEIRGITGHKDNDLARARMILCVLHLQSFPVTEELIEGKIVPRVLNRAGKKCALSVKQILAFRAEVSSVNEQIVVYLRTGTNETPAITDLTEESLSEVFSAMHLYPN